MFSQKRKRTHSDKGTKHLSLTVKQSIDNLFDKKIIYRNFVEDENESKDPFNLPCHNYVQHAPWKISQLLDNKDELNNLKNNLNDKDMLSWHSHTRRVNLAGNIANEVKYRLRPELCTQAWCKFYEIASTYLKVDTTAPYFSVHLCEAPGAFVTSFNQFLLTKGYKSEWSWLATTLNPYYEGNDIGHMIDDDRFIRHSSDNWYFGVDGTGNLMSKENLQGLRDMVTDIKVDLVTADGSIDCQGDPAEQEDVVSCLHHCEVLTALHILSPGGTFIIKMFTLLECKSICLVYLLNCMFEQVNVFKPCTSKGGNSEVYVVCLKYKGKGDNLDYLDQLTSLYFGDTEPEGCLFPLSDLPTSFLDQHTTCCSYFKDCQMTSIQRNLDLYRGDLDLSQEVKEEERSRLEQEKDYCMECFFNKYDIQPMVSEARLMKPKKIDRRATNHTTDRQHNKLDRRETFATRVKKEGKFIGSFQERQLLSTLPWQQKVFMFDTYEEDVVKEDNSLWIQCIDGPLQDSEVEHLKMVRGKSVDTIHSSRFCHGHYIAQTQDIVNNVQWLSNEQDSSIGAIHGLIATLNESVLLYRPDLVAPQHERESRQSDKVMNTGNKRSNDWTDTLVAMATEYAKYGAKGGDNGLNDSKENNYSEINKKNGNETKQSENTENGAESEENTFTSKIEENMSNLKNSIEQTESSTPSSENISNKSSETTEKGKTLVNCKLVYQNAVSGDTSCGQMSTSSMELGKQEGDVVYSPEVRFYRAAGRGIDKTFELKNQLDLCKAVVNIIQTCKPGDFVAMEIGSCLTRLSAGLMYILYRSFDEIGFIHHHGQLMRRHLIGASFRHCPIRLQENLQQTCHVMSNSQSTDAILEIFPIQTLLDDVDFVNVLHISNSNLLQSFITTVINKEKQLYTNS